MKYRKKPVVIEAIQLDDFNYNLVIKFTGGEAVVKEESGEPVLTIPTLEGDHIASVGDFIIRGIAGEYYPCKPDVFWETYEEVGA